jgi:Flp pilus assembly protein TadD
MQEVRRGPRSRTTPPAGWPAHNNLAIVLVESGRAADALPRLERAVALKPDYAEAHNELGVARMGVNLAAANEHYQIALSLDPSLARR